jgi:hypothetical protein
MPEIENDATMVVRLPASLLRHAKAVAAARDETLSQVVRRALRIYVGGGQPAKQLDIENAVAAERRQTTPRRR